MAQTKAGAEKMAARRLGVSVAEYAAQIDAGRKHCTACRQWLARDRPMPSHLDLGAMVQRLKGEGTAVFLKQLSQFDHPATYGDFDTFPRHLQIREFPKHV